MGSDANRATLCSPAVESDYCADEEDNIPRGTGRMVVVVASFRPPSIPAHGPAVGMLSVSGGFLVGRDPEAGPVGLPHGFPRPRQGEPFFVMARTPVRNLLWREHDDSSVQEGAGGRGGYP